MKAHDETGQSRMKAQRWMRRRLEAPDEVQFVAFGPPDLRLDRRRELLIRVRDEIRAHGLVLDEARTKRRVLARGAQTLHTLERDEERADRREHWWTTNVVWRSPDGPSVVVYSHDPDGHDLVFTAWGPEASRCLAAVKHLISSEGRP